MILFLIYKNLYLLKPSLKRVLYYENLIRAGILVEHLRISSILILFLLILADESVQATVNEIKKKMAAAEEEKKAGIELC